MLLVLLVRVRLAEIRLVVAGLLVRLRLVVSGGSTRGWGGVVLGLVRGRLPFAATPGPLTTLTAVWRLLWSGHLRPPWQQGRYCVRLWCWIPSVGP